MIKAIPNFPDYLISDTGIVYSIAERANRGRPKTPIIKSRWLCRGYWAVDLSANKKQIKKFVHHLVLETFIGPRPKGYQCRHLDGNPLNSKLSNLKWGTRKENQIDRLGHGTDNRGSKHGMSKLNPEKIRAIRDMANLGNKKMRGIDKGGNYKEIANIFKVSPATIGSIVSKRTWGHIK